MASYAPALITATRRGKDLFIPRSASLPPICLKCGAQATTPLRKKFYWHTPWLYLMLIFPGLLIYAIVAVIVRKQMELNLPFCDNHLEDRKRYKLIAILMLVGFIPLGALLGNLVSERLGWVTALTMFILSVAFYIMMNLGFNATRIDETGGRFRGACEQFLSAVPEQQQ